MRKGAARDVWKKIEFSMRIQLEIQKKSSKSSIFYLAVHLND